MVRLIRLIPILFFLTLFCKPALAAESAGIVLSVKINNAPRIISFRPQEGSSAYAGDLVNIDVQVQDDEGDSLLYQFSLDQLIVQPWQDLANFDLVTAELNSGVHSLKMEINDQNGAGLNQDVSFYLFLKPPDLPAL